MVIAPIFRTMNTGLSMCIGLIAEKYHDHKHRKTSLAEVKEESEASSLRLGIQQGQRMRPQTMSEYGHSTKLPRPPAMKVTGKEEVDKQTKASLIRLPHPVIVPQRRPGTKYRGFARAYAPDLGAAGVDQDTFMRFLQAFEDASSASPWLKALYVASNVTSFVPINIVVAISVSVTIATHTVIEIQRRYKANAFLDRMNRDYFMPRGLYVMVLLAKDTPSKNGDDEFGVDSVSMHTVRHISKWGLPKENEDGQSEQTTKTKIIRQIRRESGCTHTNQMPLEVAHLIYPGLDDMIQRPQITRDKSFKDRLLRNKEFVADYFDHRARADYAGNNPNCLLTKLAGDVPEFRTRFADPNHPCNNGHLLSLVTGGKYVAQPRGRGSSIREVGEGGKLKPQNKMEHKITGPISLITHPIRKVMMPDVLYLTVVNLPTDEEMEDARKELNVDKKGLRDILGQYAEGKRVMMATRYGGIIRRRTAEI